MRGEGSVDVVGAGVSRNWRLVFFKEATVSSRIWMVEHVGGRVVVGWVELAEAVRTG